MTPNQIAAQIQSPYSTSVLRNSTDKESMLPILKSYVPPPQGTDGRLYRGTVELGSPNENIS